MHPNLLPPVCSVLRLEGKDCYVKELELDGGGRMKVGVSFPGANTN